MRRLALLGVVLALLTSDPASASPQPSPPVAQPGIDVRPPADSPYASDDLQFLEIGRVQPQTLLEDAVIVRNNSKKPAETLVYAADAIAAVGGGFGVRLRTERSTQLGAWLSLSAEQIRIPAGGEVIVRFRLKVPASTPGGAYAGAIVAEPVEQSVSGVFQTVTRFAMAVTLEVPGGAPGVTPGRGKPGGAFAVEEVTLRPDGDRVCPVVRYRNDSQDVLDPVGEVSVDGPFSPLRSYKQKAAGPVLPEQTVEVRLRCVPRAVGPGEVTVRLTTPRGEGSASARSIWLPQVYFFALLAILLLVGALLTTWLRARRRKTAEPDAAAAGHS